jgi:ligand-binding SRPBCC domain-containing protein
MRKYAFVHTLEAPLERVLRFYARPDVLQLLTPPLVHVSVVRSDPLAEGSIAEFALRPLLAPSALALRWRARHVDFASRRVGDALVEHRFTDVMDLGPLAAWRHTHEFSRIDESDKSWERFGETKGGTRVRDVIELQHAPGSQGWLTRAAFNPVSLALLFTWRAYATRRQLARLGAADG